MNSLTYKVVDESLGSSKVEFSEGSYSFSFPCSDSINCTEYEITFQPGIYHISLFGASGGFADDKISLLRNEESNGCIEQISARNTECLNVASISGAGGYSSGFLMIHKPTKSFLSLGGMGSIGNKLSESGTDACYLKENMILGGFNGGGASSNYYSSTASGGGSTDLRIGTNDIFHRIIVAGGGGGADNPGGTLGGSDDGSGGGGGGMSGQGFRINGVLDHIYIANQTSGFSFGYGESVQQYGSLHPNGVKNPSGNSDRSGGGGGWFGGFSSHHGNGGGGGGSGFILTETSILPSGPIAVYDDFYSHLSTNYYAFSHNSLYIFQYPKMSSGVWKGNGFAQIQFYFTINFNECTSHLLFSYHNIPYLLVSIILSIL